MEPAIEFIICFPILCIVFGLHLLGMNIKRHLRIVFFLLCVIIAAASYVASLLYFTKDRATFALLERTYFVLMAICWAVNLNFFFLLTEHAMQPHHYIFFYSPTVALIAADFIVGHIIKDYAWTGSRWEFIFSPMYYVFIFYTVFYCGICAILASAWARRSKVKKHRLQARTLLSTTIPLCLFGIAVDYIVPQFTNHRFFPICSYCMMIYISVLWFSFAKYGLMTSEASILLQNVVLNVEEVLILIDKEARILFHNKRLADIVGDRPNLKKQAFTDYIEERRDFMDKVLDIVSGKANYSYASLTYRGKAETLPTSSYLSRILDNFGDLVGILVISRENKGMRQFRDRFKISERQMEIINRMLSGLSNAEISGKLGISKKTTETHISNIYNKLGIDNKIELYNLTAGFHLLPTIDTPREEKGNRA